MEYTAYTALLLYGLPSEKIGSQMHPGMMNSFKPMVLDLVKNREDQTNRFAVKWESKRDTWHSAMDYGGDRDAL